MAKFGDTLKHYRTLARMSQEDLARLVGVPTRQIEAWEHKDKPGPKLQVARRINKLAKALKVAPEVLLGYVKEGPEGRGE